MKHAYLLLIAIMMVTVSTVWGQCPTITAANISRGTDPGQCSAVVGYTPTITPATAMVTYTFTGATVGTGSGTGSGSTFSKGITTVRLTATDNGCATTKTFKVTVSDYQKPVFTNCPQSYAFYADPGECGAILEYTNPTATDNCGTVVVTRIAGPSSGSAFPVGTTMVRFRATDAAGNIATCSFNLTVVDDQAPSITCPANITVTQSQGCAGGTAYFPNPTSSDNCGINATYLFSGLASGSCFPIGVSTNTWRTTDNNGNSATCTHTVTVIAAGSTPNAEAADRGTTETEKFQVFPNPTNSGTVTMFTTNGATLFSVTGQLISSWSENSKEISLLSPGVYYVKSNGGATKCLVVTQ